jgi:hypothetical protein
MRCDIKVMQSRCVRNFEVGIRRANFKEIKGYNRVAPTGYFSKTSWLGAVSIRRRFLRKPALSGGRVPQPVLGFGDGVSRGYF